MERAKFCFVRVNLIKIEFHFGQGLQDLKHVALRPLRIKGSSLVFLSAIDYPIRIVVLSESSSEGSLRLQWPKPVVRAAHFARNDGNSFAHDRDAGVYGDFVQQNVAARRGTIS
jgi:hypothetical protein